MSKMIIRDLHLCFQIVMEEFMKDTIMRMKDGRERILDQAMKLHW